MIYFRQGGINLTPKGLFMDKAGVLSLQIFIAQCLFHNNLFGLVKIFLLYF